MRHNLEPLVKRLKNNDESAFEKIYDLTHRQIFFVILPIVKDSSLAEDIVQDTYLKFLQKLNDYKSKNLLAFLITIARNHAINEYNRRKKITKIEDFEQFAYLDFVEFKVEANEIIKKALSVLDNDELNIFLLHVLENLTHREIALIIDKPHGTVSWLYSKAIKKMQQKLKDENYEY